MKLDYFKFYKVVNYVVLRNFMFTKKRKNNTICILGLPCRSTFSKIEIFVFNASGFPSMFNEKNYIPISYSNQS